jgi:hypothetical protein
MMVTTLADARLWRERDVSWLDDNDSPAEKGLRNAVIVATRPSGPDMDLNRLSRSRVSFCWRTCSTGTCRRARSQCRS